MAQEIERKFLVIGDYYKTQAYQSTHILQGYLSSLAERTVRIRIKGERAFITIKGRTNSSGMTRYEWEKEIGFGDAKELLTICESGVIEKTRHEVKSGLHIFEVDEFHGENQGLVVAEVELSNEEEPYIKPDWIGKEVTGEAKYYNSELKKRPFNKW